MVSDIYPIISYGNASLREENIPIKYKSDMKNIISDMFSTMYNSGGIGLAAPQIGKNIQIFIIDISHIKDKETGHPFYKSVFINPEIIEETGEPWEFREGCLSLPGIMINIKRKPVIKIKYFDENWEPQEQVLDKMLARVIQHEYDHLKGILHIDYASDLKKKSIKKKLSEIMNGKINVAYKMKFKS